MTTKATELIKKKMGIQKGAGDHKNETAGDISMELAIEIAKEKTPILLANDLKGATKEIIGTALTMGITVEGKDPREAQREISEGKYDSLFS
jgi:large subunit ribosomal protein L11